MILDQGTGAHHAQVETLGLWARTWVSGSVLDVATITGKWSDIERVYANRERVGVSANRERVIIRANRERIEVQG